MSIRCRSEGIDLRYLNLGGGFSIRYRDESDFDVEAFSRDVAAPVAARGLTLVIEPGRYLVAQAGLLLTRVEYLKPAPAEGYRNFAIVDAAMNDLMRPALYQAWHRVEPVIAASASPRRWDIVGPVCETADFLALDRDLALEEDALLAISGAGAYGMALASNYNSRSRPPEVLVHGDVFRVVRRRETVRDQLAPESE